MPSARTYSIFFIIFLLCTIQTTQPMQEREANDAVQGIANLQLNDNDSYYSDSEDEEGYDYQGLPPLAITDEKNEKVCIALARGIHFSPSKFTRQEISHMRKTNDSGEDIFSSAAYDLAHEPLGSTKNKNSIRAEAVKIRALIKQFPSNARNRFQEIYSNQYDRFHQLLGTYDMDGTFQQFNSKKNPQVSTAENFFHANKYTSALKFLGANIESLDPEYDSQGKPKHPYLGKLFVILVNTDQVEELDPYFVVHGHANDNITISNHYSKNVLEEREVSFPGFIPGDCVALSTSIRVPSFKGDYKPWYHEKFGISKRAYDARKKILTTGKHFRDEKRDPLLIKQKTVKSLLEDIILPHAAEKLKQHIAKECGTKNIRLAYKELDGTFGQALPPIPNANNRKKLIKQQNECPNPA